MTVEEVLFKLEEQLKQIKLSNFRNGSVHLTAIQISLQKLKRLKREAEALKRALKDKASAREQKKLNQVSAVLYLVPFSFQYTKGFASFSEVESSVSLLFLIFSVKLLEIF
jgi:hypothetical protein